MEVDSSFAINTFINYLMSESLQIKELDLSQSFSNRKVQPWHNNIFTDDDIIHQSVVERGRKTMFDKLNQTFLKHRTTN